MRVLTFLSVLLLLPLSSSIEAQRRRYPAGVQILRHGQGIHGVGSPDDRHFAYWGRRALEVYDVERQRRVRVDDAPQLGAITCAGMGWSADATKVAFTHEHGVGEFDLSTGQVRVVYREPDDPYGHTRFCSVGYDADDRIGWTRHHRNGTALFREGRAAVPFPAGFGAGRFALLSFGPSSGATHFLVVNRDTHRAARLDLTRPSASFELLGDGFARPYADRAGRRLCWSASDGLNCRDLQTGNVASLGRGDVLGTMEAHVFSPSGNRMIFHRDFTLLMHDFTTGEQRVVKPLTLAGGSLAFRGAAFSGEDHVLLFEHHQERDRRGPAIERVDLRSGETRVLLRDRQQHCYAEVVDPDTVFVFRTNMGGGEDLTRVHFPSTR